MNNIPITIVDDFLDRPYELQKWALNLPFEHTGVYPGKKTEQLQDINPRLFRYLSEKILSIFIPLYHGPHKIDSTKFECSMCFNLIESNGTGWIHQDPNLFTTILYLDKDEDVNCGTNLYELNSNEFFPILSKEDDDLNEQRFFHHKTGKISKELELSKKEWENNKYKLSLSIPNKFNRLIGFSSEMFHAANYFQNSNSSSRLTLLCFFNFINSEFSLPIPRSKSIRMI